MTKKKKILILGGEGYVGRNVIEFLNRFYDCHSLDVKKSKFRKGKDKFIKKNPYKKLIKNNYDVVIHLIDNSDKNFSKNENELIKKIDLNSKNHLILFSSAVIYANPASDYGKRKLKLEEIYKRYCAKNKIKLTIFRLFNTYGPYQIPFKQGSLIANIFCNHLNGKPTEINDMNAKRDFVYAKDIGKFVCLAIESSAFGTFDLATGRLVSIGQIIKLIEKTVKKKLAVIDRKNKENLICPKAKGKLMKKIDLFPLENGIKETFGFYKKEY